jgi:hypothetical protein
MRATQVKRGDFIKGFGRVTEIRHYENDVANRKSSMTPAPKLKGKLLKARLIAESQEQAYNKELGSVAFFNVANAQLIRRPDQQVTVLSAPVATADAAAA